VKAKRKIGYLWVGVFISVIIYHGLLLFKLVPVVEPPAPAYLVICLLALGAVKSLFVAVLDIFRLSRPSTVQWLEKLARVKALSDAPEAIRERKKQYYTGAVTGFILFAESIGLYGFLLGILSAERWAVLTLFTLSYATLLYVFIRSYTRWEKLFLKGD
jgi:hypothetical protein